MYYQTCILIFLFLLSLSLGFEGDALLKMFKTALREFDPDNSISQIKNLFLKENNVKSNLVLLDIMLLLDFFHVLAVLAEPSFFASHFLIYT